MNDSRRETLSQVAQDILRATAFAFGDPCAPAELPECGPAAIKARLRFQGHVSGELILAMPPDLCASLAADILTEDAAELGVEQTHDAIKELLNVIAGNWLTAVHGDQPAFALSTPLAETVEAAEWGRLCSHDESVGVVIDGRPLLVALCQS